MSSLRHGLSARGNSLVPAETPEPYVMNVVAHVPPSSFIKGEGFERACEIAERLAACWNACAGMGDGALEQHGLGGILREFEAYVCQKASLLRDLEEIRNTAHRALHTQHPNDAANLRRILDLANERLEEAGYSVPATPALALDPEAAAMFADDDAPAGEDDASWGLPRGGAA